MDWLDILAVQGILKSLLQHNSWKASILRWSAFFTVQLSHPYMTTGKTIALTRQTFVDKVMSLLFNMLSRLVITFLLRSKCLLILWLQSPSAVILEPPKIKSATLSTSICHEVMGLYSMILVFWMLSFMPTFSQMIFLLYSVNPLTCALHLIPSFLLVLALSTFPLLFCIFNLSCSLFFVLIIYTSPNLKLDFDSISPLKLIKKMINNFPKAKYYAYISNPIFLGLSLPLNPGDYFSLKVFLLFLWCIFLIFSFLEWLFF